MNIDEDDRFEATRAGLMLDEGEEVSTVPRIQEGGDDVDEGDGTEGASSSWPWHWCDA